MKLKYSPYQIFVNRKTPASLYARKKWLGEEEADNWKKDFREAVEIILGKKIWDEKNTLSVLRKLFDLHLTVREENPEIIDAVEKLLLKSEIIFNKKDISIIGEEEIGNLPFAEGESYSIIPAAALFTAAVFNQDKNPLSEKLYTTLIDFSREAGEGGSLRIFRHNLFRALAVNSRYSDNPETGRILKMLISSQSNKGDFGGRLPFYQAVNAAAHISSNDSDILFKKALPLIVKSQNPDGSWGKGDSRERNTFLTVHALRNKSVI